VPQQTDSDCHKLLPAGRFIGACHVVSMRPYLPEAIERVREVTRPYLQMHGKCVKVRYWVLVLSWEVDYTCFGLVQTLPFVRLS
jgi:uncharacterized protein YcsI (UPF0317 family)